jgi:hypothetical protein
VESPNNFLEIIKGMRGSPLVESPGKLCKIKAFEEKDYRKSVVLRNIDSVFPDDDVKMLSHNLYLPKAQCK